jgi:hypothetical protein
MIVLLYLKYSRIKRLSMYSAFKYNSIMTYSLYKLKNPALKTKKFKIRQVFYANINYSINK